MWVQTHIRNALGYKYILRILVINVKYECLLYFMLDVRSCTTKFQTHKYKSYIFKLLLGKCVPYVCRKLSPLSIKVQGEHLKRPRLSMQKKTCIWASYLQFSELCLQRLYLELTHSSNALFELSAYLEVGEYSNLNIEHEWPWMLQNTYIVFMSSMSSF